MQRIKKGDEIIVLAGRDKGKRGTVLRRVDAQHGAPPAFVLAGDHDDLVAFFDALHVVLF